MLFPPSLGKQKGQTKGDDDKNGAIPPTPFPFSWFQSPLDDIKKLPGDEPGSYFVYLKPEET